MANSADPDQKPTDLDLHCLQSSAGKSLRQIQYEMTFDVPSRIIADFFLNNFSGNIKLEISCESSARFT